MPAADNEDDQFEKDNFLEKIKNLLFTTYHPAQKYKEGVFFMTTHEIYNMLQRLYPNNHYGPEHVALWMNENGFTFIDQGHMRFEWMLSTNTNTHLITTTT